MVSRVIVCLNIERGICSANTEHSLNKYIIDPQSRLLLLDLADCILFKSTISTCVVRESVFHSSSVPGDVVLGFIDVEHRQVVLPSVVVITGIPMLLVRG